MLHRLFVVFDVHGCPLVGLRISDGPSGRGSWSGWHGQWRVTTTGDFAVLLHWSGSINVATATPFMFHRVPGGYTFMQNGALLWVHARMRTLVLTQRQISDAEKSQEWVIVP